jgi:hypothetical protein
MPCLYFRRLSSGHHEAGLQMAARIKDVVEQHGGSMRLSAVKRAVHAYRHQEAWKEGMHRVVLHRIAAISKGKIDLTWSDTIDLPDPYAKPSTAKRRRPRQPTKWFEQNRPKMDRGQHLDFDQDWDEED